MDSNTKALVGKASNLKTEALVELKAELVAEFKTKRAEELTVTAVSELTDLSRAIESVTTELSNRDDTAPAAVEEPAVAEPTVEELAEEAAKLEAAVESATADPEPAVELKSKADAEDAKDGGADEAEEDANGKKKAVAASAEDEARPPADLSPAGLESDLGEAGHVPATITAGADITGFRMGQELDGLGQVAEAFMARRLHLRGGSSEADGDQVIVASIRGNYDTEHTLDAADIGSNLNKIQSSQDAVVASGGLCAPLEPYYGIQVISQAARPVRDALPQFTADRGGVRFLPPPQLTDLANAIGATTAAQDAGTYGTGEGQTPFKPCLHVTCPSEQTVTVTAVHRCLTFGNFAARTYPEQVEAWLALSIAQHARRAEGLLLDAIAAASTAVTASQVYGAATALLTQVDRAVAGYRSRQRMGDATPLRIMLPVWVRDLLRTDLALSFQGNDLDPINVSDAQITEWFTRRSVNVTWYLDTPTGSGQVFAAQGAGALLAFPTSVVWFLFVDGSFVFLDGGTLDLGLVRDSTLNSTNDYQIFAETFEAVAFYGIQSLKITSTVCPNGIHAPAATGAITC